MGLSVQGLGLDIRLIRFTHTPLSSSFLGLSYRILNRNHKRSYLGASG